MTPLRLLVCEDDEYDYALLLRHLQTRWSEIVSARVDAEENLRAALAAPWDVVLLDFNVPGLDGLKALEIVSAREPFVPAIVVSGFIGEEVAVAAMRAGARDFVSKENFARLIPAMEREIRETRVEVESRAAEERFRATFEQSAVGIVHALVDGTILRVNGRFAAMLGYQPEELVGRHVRSLTHPDDAVFEGEESRDMVARSTSASFEKRYLHRDGSPVWVLLTLSVARGAAERGPYFIGVVQDISERKKQEEALRVSEERFRNVMEQASDGIFIADVDLRYVDVNPRGCEIAGWTREEILSMRIEELAEIEPGRPLRIEELQTGSVVISERRLRRSDGSTVTAEISARRLSDGRYLGIVRDITRRKRAEELALEALRANEERLRALLENGHDLIGILDESLTVRFIVGPIGKLLGYDSKQVLGQRPFEFTHPDDEGEVAPFFERLRRGGGTARMECRVRTLDGSWRWLEVVASNLLDHPGVGGIVINARDVTERRLLQSQIEQSERLAGLGRLAANMAHEFNNVLMGIQPFAEVIRRHLPDDQSLAQASTHIEASIQRGKRVTQEILRFGRGVDPVRAPMDVRRWLEEIGPEMQALVGEKVTLRLLPPPRPAVIHGDRAQLTQILFNLLVNARDAMRGRGEVALSVDTPLPGSTLDVSALAGFVHLAVRDTGPGMDTATRARVFEPFFTTKTHGTGLGLAIAQQTVLKHEGHLFVESEPGHGTTFHIFLPRSRSQVEADTASAPKERPRLSGRVLLVEDDDAVSSGLTTLLELDGFEVTCVDSGAGALRSVETSTPDVVVLDIGLPDIDGVEVCCRLRELRPDLPVIFSSGHGDQSQIEGTGDPLVWFIQKPYETAALLDLIAEALEARRNAAADLRPAT